MDSVDRAALRPKADLRDTGGGHGHDRGAHFQIPSQCPMEEPCGPHCPQTLPKSRSEELARTQTNATPPWARLGAARAIRLRSGGRRAPGTETAVGTRGGSHGAGVSGVQPYVGP